MAEFVRRNQSVLDWPSVSNEFAKQVLGKVFTQAQFTEIYCVILPRTWSTTANRLGKATYYLKYKPYKLQLLQILKQNDKHTRIRLSFCESMQALVEDDNFVKRLVFTKEVKFLFGSKVNRPSIRIWSPENPHAFNEHVHDSPKVYVFCAMVYNKV